MRHTGADCIACPLPVQGASWAAEGAPQDWEECAYYGMQALPDCECASTAALPPLTADELAIVVDGCAPHACPDPLS